MKSKENTYLLCGTDNVKIMKSVDDFDTVLKVLRNEPNPDTEDTHTAVDISSGKIARVTRDSMRKKEMIFKGMCELFSGQLVSERLDEGECIKKGMQTVNKIYEEVYEKRS